jgi:hypothetical protein
MSRALLYSPMGRPFTLNLLENYLDEESAKSIDTENVYETTHYRKTRVSCGYHRY